MAVSYIPQDKVFAVCTYQISSTQREAIELAKQAAARAEISFIEGKD